MQIYKSYSVLFLSILLCSFLTSSISLAHDDHSHTHTHKVNAGKVTDENFSSTAIRGIDAIGGIDDWFLTNGTLCATISDKKHETYLSVTGGFLIDLGNCEKNNDQWPALHFLTNLSKSDILPANKITVTNNDFSSSVIVSGLRDGVKNTTQYTVNNKQPHTLFITNTLERIKPGKKIRLFGSMVLHPQRALTPFAIDDKKPTNSKGFTFPKTNTDDILSLIKAMSSQDKHILLGSKELKPVINYSIAFKESWLTQKNGEKKPLSFFSLNNEDVSLMAVFTRPLPFTQRGRPSIFDIPSVTAMDIKKGESITFKQEITLLDKNYPQKTYLTHSKKVNVSNGTLLLPRDAIMRLTIKGINGTPDPIFNKDNYTFSVGDTTWGNHSQTQHIFLTDSDSDLKKIRLPTGDYHIYASRGIEYSITEAKTKIRKNTETKLIIDTPKKEIITQALISADLHVHSAASFDSALPVATQMKRLIVENVDIALFSEHHRVVNHKPSLKKLNLDNKIQLITGAEFTSLARSKKNPRTIGHQNIFPLNEQLKSFAGGMMGNPNNSLADLIEEAHKKENRVIQLNHARDSLNRKRDGYFLEHLSIGESYNPKKPLDDYPNNLLIKKNPQGINALAIDAMELLNGTNLEPYEKLKLDWFSFLNAGYVITATGNSDSHTAQNTLGIPRNYFIQQKESSLQASVVKGIQQQNNFISTGPILDATVNGKPIGSIINTKIAELHIVIKAVDWLEVQSLHIYKNGKLVITKAINKNQSYSFSLPFIKDGYIVVEVIGRATDKYRAIYGTRATPIAITNPFFIDASSDGLWQ